MRELRLTKIDSRIYLFPVPVVKGRKYLIYCSSEEEAKAIISNVAEKKMTHPDLISEHFVFLTFHNDGETKIFVPSPGILIS
jgi:hypothetical protein